MHTTHVLTPAPCVDYCARRPPTSLGFAATALRSWSPHQRQTDHGRNRRWMPRFVPHAPPCHGRQCSRLRARVTHHTTQVNEYLCWGSFLSAHQQHSVWLAELRKPLPHKPQPIVGMGTSAERVRYTEAVTHHAREIRRRCAQVEACMHRAVDALVDVLTFEGGWLLPAERDDGTREDDIGAHVELAPPANASFANLSLSASGPSGPAAETLRRRCLPPIAMMLHQVCGAACQCYMVEMGCRCSRVHSPVAVTSRMLVGVAHRHCTRRHCGR